MSELWTPTTTIEDLAQSQAFGGEYVPSNKLVFGVPLCVQNTASGAVAQPTAANATFPFAQLVDAVSGNETALFGPQVVPLGWTTATVSVIYSADSAASGNFRVRANVAWNPADGVAAHSGVSVWEATATPPSDASGLPRWQTLSSAATVFLMPGRYVWPTVTRACIDPADTNTGSMRLHAVVLSKAT